MPDRTFAFADLSGFVALTEAHGDDEAVATLTRFRRIANSVLGPHDLLVKTIGDAIMLAFYEPTDATAALRRLFDSTLADPAMPLIRAGAHHGAAVEDTGDFFGAAVNLAARVAARAGGGQLLATEAVALAARDAGEVVTHLGPVTLRNIAEPVDIYEIELQHGSEIAIDPVCAMKVPKSGPSVVHLKHGDRDVWFCGLPCVTRYATAPERYR